jgi:hypothetical protein
VRVDRHFVRENLIWSRINYESSLEGFYKYIDLSVDIFDFISDTDFSTGARWFKECFSSWFDERRARRVLDLLYLWDEYADPRGQGHIWYRRKLAVTELSRIASGDSGEISVTP